MYKKKEFKLRHKTNMRRSSILTLSSLSRSLVLFCMLLLQQNERKNESERGGEYKINCLTTTTAHTHNHYYYLTHLHSLSLSIYTHCFVRRLLLHSQPLVCWQTPCAAGPPPLPPSVRHFSDVLKSQTRTRNATQRKF